MHEDVDNFHGLEVNIAIASAITAGARMWMSTFKNNPNFNIYYTDTDSIVVDKMLPADLVGEALGQTKLEYIIDRAVFLAPKVYGLITSDGTEIIKVKGLRSNTLSNVHIQDLEELLIKDSTKLFNQKKMIKSILHGGISVKDVAYTLQVTSNKRQPVFINDIISNTLPFHYDDINK